MRSRSHAPAFGQVPLPFPRATPDRRSAAVRRAEKGDLANLVELEERCFATDRLAGRNYRRLLQSPASEILVVEQAGELLGSAVLLYRTGSPIARLYSFATDPERRREGIGQQLLAAAGEAALARDCVQLRLETRSDNQAAQALFRKAGFHDFGTYRAYYQDGANAVRMEKSLAEHLHPDLRAIPYYPQSQDFTCGPAALMMAMKALQPDLELTRTLELRLWRESTTIFMTSGMGGCSPLGLALAAHRRGFSVGLHMSDQAVPFVDSVRSKDKKKVIRLVHDEMTHELAGTDISIRYDPLPIDSLERELNRGGVPIVLISSYRIYGEKLPHYVVVTGFDGRFAYVHDPFHDKEGGKTRVDNKNRPIPRREFDRIARYGKTRSRAAIIVRAREKA
jgi:ribosomal protein S18 acetylase RimI-like enzyme